MAKEAGGFPIRIAAPDQQFRRRFNSEDEVRRFLEAESTYWDQFSSLYSNQQIHGPTPELINLLTRQRIRDATGNAGNPSNLEADLKGFIFSQGSYGRILSDLAQSCPLAVPGAILAFSAKIAPDRFAREAHQYNGIRVTFSTFASLIASLEATRSPSREVTALRAKLSDLVDEAQALRDEITTLKNDETQQHESQIRAAVALVEQHREQFAGVTSAAKNDLDEMLERSKRQLMILKKRPRIESSWKRRPHIGLPRLGGIGRRQ